MSFDLAFLNSQEVPGLHQAVGEWARAQPFFTQHGASQLAYDNPHTGVYFTLDAHPVERPPGKGLSPTGLSFNLNYVRPRGFALESFAIVEALVTKFALVVDDPQGEIIAKAPFAPLLVESWLKGNRSAVKLMRELGQPLPFMDPTASARFWLYRHGREARARELGADYFVPQLFPAQHEGRAVGVAVLTEPTQYVLPPADYFLVDRGEIKGLVRANKVREMLQPFLTTDSARAELGVVGSSTIYDPSVIETWDRFYDTVPLDLTTDQLQKLAPDGFVDEP